MNGLYKYILVLILFLPSCKKQDVSFEEITHSVNSGNFKKIDIYLKSGGDPNFVDKQGNSLLLLAIMNNDFKIFERLLKSGADPSFRNNRGNPRKRLVVMERAAIVDDERFLKASLMHGADPNTPCSYNEYGVTFQSVMVGNLNNLKILIEHDADINSIGLNGKTLIHTAISIKNFEIAYYLFEKGANMKISDKWGYSSIDTLKMFGDAGMKYNSDHYKWYLKFLRKLDINPEDIGRNKNKS